MTQPEVYLKVKLLSNTATVPTRGTKYSAGYDLYASENCYVGYRTRNLIKTDISISFPNSHYVRIAPRSGLAVKKGIDIGAGVIDSDYTGEIKIAIFNHSDQNFEIKKGDRIAQMILTKIDTPDIEVVEEIDRSERGSNGFGSTGV